MMRTETQPETERHPARQELAHLLFGAYRHRVLSLLFLRPGDRFHVRMISRLTGVPAGSLHRELRQLADAGLLVAIRSGNQVLYSANEDSPVFRELAAMLDKTAGTTPTLHDHAAEYTVDPPAGSLVVPDNKELAEICRRYKVKKMSLFGSAARGELRPDSDVDLLVEFKPKQGPSMWGLVDMQDALSPLFGGRHVHIAGPGILNNPHRRKTIERDLKVLYGR
ncbi:MAG TPA: nucleotidyltransferase domain-containing protein [Burkholderiales bacterium]|nr:nucleotidyltransferase domain-containing protein [Burkholderiales bacterium]